jgi:glycosyltransferase involved in cell wall biosynthesis
MINNNITISVVCPTFNSQNFIERTLKSVFSQTVTVDEIIVSDDGSTDDTVKTVERIFSEYDGGAECRLLKGSHGGPGATRNKGIVNAESSWIAFIDSDDIWQENKVEVVVQTIQENPNVNFICHDEYRIGIHKEKTIINCSERYQASKPLVSQLYRSNIFSTSAVTCQRSLLIEGGMFDEDLMSIQDYELWLKLSLHLDVFFIKRVLGTYVERYGNITSNNRVERFANEFSVLLRYRQMVPVTLFLVRIPRMALSHLYQFVKFLKVKSK